MKEMKLDGLREKLLKPAKVVITNHINPDGDAMGSALALQIILQQLGHKVDVIVPNIYPQFLHWMHGNNQVIVGDENLEISSQKIAEADFIFHLDYNAYSRTGELESLLREAKATKILIDHHQQPETWPDYIFSDTSMSSTCQMIYEFAEMNGWLTLITKDAGECLYTGMVTDTGSFRFSSTSAKTLKIAAHLMEIGVKPDDVFNRVFDNNTVGRLKLLGTLLAQMIYVPKKRAVLLFLSQKDQEKNNYQRGDSEGFVNYGLSISGINFSVFLREDVDQVKVSLRSKGNFDVNALARAKFNGGGHVNAAGGLLKMNIDEAKAYAQKVIEELNVDEAK